MAWININPQIADPVSWSGKLENAGMSVLRYDTQTGRLYFRVTGDDVTKNHDLLKELFLASYQEFTE
jgi:hypothetical protein